jgi:hypothetical protein
MNITGLVSMVDHSRPIFDLMARLETATVETVFLEALENVSASLIYEKPDPVTRHALESSLYGLLSDLMAMRVVYGVSGVLFTEYTIRNLPNNGARVTFTGRNFFGNEKLVYSRDFQFYGNLLPTWAKQQIREGLGMVSLVSRRHMHPSKVLFRGLLH